MLKHKPEQMNTASTEFGEIHKKAVQKMDYRCRTRASVGELIWMNTKQKPESVTTKRS